MEKKRKPKPPWVITITLPSEGVLPRTGSLVVRQGTLATIRQFQYQSLDEVTRALDDGVAHLLAVEAHPPVLSATGSRPAAAPAAQADPPEAQAAGDEGQQPEGGGDETAEDADDTESAAGDISLTADPAHEGQDSGQAANAFASVSVAQGQLTMF